MHYTTNRWYTPAIRQVAIDCLSLTENDKYDKQIRSLHGRLSDVLGPILRQYFYYAFVSRDDLWLELILLAHCVFKHTFASVPLDSAMKEVDTKSPFMNVHLKLFGHLLRLSQRFIQREITACA